MFRGLGVVCGHDGPTTMINGRSSMIDLGVDSAMGYKYTYVSGMIHGASIS